MRLPIYYLLLITAISRGERCARLVDETPGKCFPSNISKMVSGKDDLKLSEYVPVTSKTAPLFPPWFDLELARTGQKFSCKYFAQLVFANIMSLVVSLSDLPTRRALFLTRKSNTPERAFKRYVSTAQQVHLWYHSDILDPSWAKSISNVREIHNYASNYLESLNPPVLKSPVHPEDNPKDFQPNERLWKAFKMDLAKLNYEDQPTDYHYSAPKFQFKQYGWQMAIWPFIALPILNPETLGIEMPSDEKGLQGFIHLWSVIGYALGTDEENIYCKDAWSKNEWQGCKHHLREILLKTFLPQLINLDFEGKTMIESMLLGFTARLGVYPLEAVLINLLEEHLGVSATHVREQCNFLSLVIGTTANNFLTRYSTYFPPLRWLANTFGIATLQLASFSVFRNFGTNSTIVSNKHFYY